MSQKPLKKYRIIDLTNVLSGPFCTHLLANMGAEVIKVEIPGSGDLARQLGADPELNEKGMGVSFLAQNAGKRSVTINLKSLVGKELFKRLIETADILVENFRPGVMARLGLGFDDLKLINSSLVYCAISGYGSTGPLKYQPAYDQIIQGMSGAMSITGDTNSTPLRVGYPIADTLGGMTAAFAITSALAGRNKSDDEAVFIDVSMLSCMLSSMGWVVSNYLIAGKIPEAMGNDNFTASPSGTFQTGSGQLNIAANKQEQFENLCKVINRSDLINDPRFRDRTSRLHNRKELTLELEKTLCEESACFWQEKLSTAGVPAGLVLTVPEILNHEHLKTRGMVGHYDDVPGVGSIDLFRPGFRINGMTPQVDTPPPTLGQHTDDILYELGLSVTEIESLKEDKVV